MVKLWDSPRCGLVLGTACLLLSAVGSVRSTAMQSATPQLVALLLRDQGVDTVHVGRLRKSHWPAPHRWSPDVTWCHLMSPGPGHHGRRFPSFLKLNEDKRRKNKSLGPSIQSRSSHMPYSVFVRGSCTYHHTRPVSGKLSILGGLW